MSRNSIKYIENRVARTPDKCSNGASYIERDFPVEHLTPIVTREANAKKPIYQIHKWWARRLGGVFRMLLIASFSDQQETRRDAWKKWMYGYSLEGKMVLDPMMGGGTTVVETLKLGGKVVGTDINPVAWFVTKKEVEPINLAEVQKCFETLEESVGSEIKKLYETRCVNGHTAEIMYAIWHKQFDCAECGKVVPVLQDYVISEKENEMVIFCPSCKSIFTRNRNVKSIVTCTNCSYRFNPRLGTARKGHVKCPHCRHTESVIDAVKRKGGPLEINLFCIEYYCKECGRHYKRAEPEDIKKYSEAEKTFSRLREKLPFPKEVIPGMPNNDRPKNHGYEFFHQLFNTRQLLCLSMLLKGIQQIEDRNAREFLLLVFSSCLETNNLFCKYETKWQKSSAMFGVPGYLPVDRTAENNVWGTKYGRGTFTKCYQKMLRAKRQVDAAHMADKNAHNGEWFTHTASSLKDLKESKRNALLFCANSESLSFMPNESVDLIATDPPYFDSLNYSRLADFFYVWLRIALKDDYECFKPKTSAREREVVMNSAAKRTADELVESLTKIFAECNRVLKPNRPMVFTFHHTQDWAWRGLLKAVNAGGFSIVESHFIRSEGKTGFRKSGFISYDVCLVCRKSKEVMVPEEPLLAVSSSKRWIRRLVRSGNGLHDSDVHSIVMGNLLTYTPKMVLEGFTNEEWIESVMEKCVRLKNNLESEMGYDKS